MLYSACKNKRKWTKNLIYAKDDKIMFSCTDYPLPFRDNAECTLKWKFYKKKLDFTRRRKD